MKFSDMQDVYKTQKTALNRQDSGLERAFLPELPDIQSHALVVCGIRRCGKSTLLHQFLRKLGRNFFYFNFDDIRLADFSHADYRLLDQAIAESGAKMLFFDEIQSAGRWELYVRQKLNEGFQLLITGSNASLLSRELGSRLTGRHISKELFTFSYREFCAFTGQEAGADSVESYLAMGGFPEYLKTGNMDILTQLQSDILYRDIAVRYGIRDAASLRRLFVYLVSNPAQQVSPSKLIHTAGVKSPTTVLEYISYFEAAYLIHLLPCFAWSVKAQSLAPKKIYIADTGIIKTASVSFSGNRGALLENCVYNTLREEAARRGDTADLYYFTDKQGGQGECDFIVNPGPLKKGGQPRCQPYCIQVCHELNSENQDREIKGLLAAMEFFNQKEGTMVTFNTEDTVLTAGKEISVVPYWKWCADKGQY